MTHLIVGCGYLGKTLARLWLAQSHRVLATTRGRGDELAALGIEPIVCDVLDPATLRFPTVDAVAYAVALDRNSGRSMRDVYVQGLANVLEQLPPSKFVYVSSSSVYGQTAGEWVDETSVTEPGEESGQVVLEAERLLQSRRPEANILRFSGIYGPGRLLRQKSILAGETIVGDADKWLNLIHVHDGAAAVAAAAERAEPGRTFNVCDHQPVRRRDFYREMARLLGAPEPKFVSPEPGTPTPPHEKGNRRIRNERLTRELAFAFAYPDFVRGLRGSLRDSV